MNDKLEVFNKLVVDQFAYGGTKYAKTSEKEATDCLFDDHGFTWLVGTIDKYTYRYTNLARERDLLKIATYMYIIWLKRGFHINNRGTDEVINTTVPVKSANFDRFMSLSKAYFYDTINDPDSRQYMIHIHEMMVYWSEEKFTGITEEEIFAVYKECFLEWFNSFSTKAGQDTDTHNEEKR